MFHIRIICAVSLLAISMVVGCTSAKEGYIIETRADGTSWGIDRSTQNLNFSIEGVVSGSGNFTRDNRINTLAGISFREKSSAVRGGSISLEDDMELQAREKPVTIKYNLESVFVNGTEHGRSNIVIDEQWMTYFRNYNNINYIGESIRAYDRYDDNGEISSVYSDSWKLSKESSYSSFNNRTIILAKITPNSVAVDRLSNKSSIYFLDLSSIGSLTRIDLISKRPNDEKVYDVSRESISRNTQDYAGMVETTLKVSDFSSFRLDGNYTLNGNYTLYENGNADYTNYLSCCNNDSTLQIPEDCESAQEEEKE